MPSSEGLTDLGRPAAAGHGGWQWLEVHLLRTKYEVDELAGGRTVAVTHAGAAKAFVKGAGDPIDLPQVEGLKVGEDGVQVT